MRKPTVLNAVIANGESLSAAVNVQSVPLCRIIMPAEWTAANLTLQTSSDGTTFNNLYNEDGTEVLIQAAASRSILLYAGNYLGIAFIKVRSGTSGSPVAQGAARNIGVIAIEF